MVLHTINMLRTKMLTFVNLRWLGAALIGILCLFFSLPAHAQLEEFAPSYNLYGWQIDSFDSEIEVLETGEILITERILTNFNSSFNKHGIYRDIPIVYGGSYGSKMRMNVQVEEILQNGVPAEYKKSREGGFRRYRIGDADLFVSGPVEYVIRYRVERGVLFFDERDEFYWDITGNDWEVPIALSTARVTLPDGVQIFETACYTGSYGSTQQNCEIVEMDGDLAFAANDYLTVAVGFSKGVVTEPSIVKKVFYVVRDNVAGLIPIVAMPIIFLAWYVFGKDPKTKTVVAEFAPPADVSPVSAGFLLTGGFRRRFIGAMIVDLAVKGYLKIDIDEEKVEKTKFGKTIPAIAFTRLKSEAGLEKSYRELMQGLFPGKKDRRTMKEVQTSMSSNTRGYKISKAIQEHAVESGWFTKGSFDGVILVGGCSFIFGFFAFYFLGNGAVLVGILYVVAAIYSAVFGVLMKRYTSEGAEIARHIRGFKLFMHTAERYRSQWQEDQYIFEKYLPYAIAFNQVKRWARTFDGMDLQKPEWLNAKYRYIDALSITHHLSTVNTSIQNMSTFSQANGGSGGGGFSGGGGGGGGGGSW